MTQFKAWLIQHNGLVLAASVLIIAAAIAGIFYQTLANEEQAYSPTESWYYDIKEGDLFTETESAIPPIAETPNAPHGEGSIGVGVRLFSCGDCAEDERFIGWLEKYTPRGKDRIKGFIDQAPREALDELAGNEKLIAAPPGEEEPADDLRWYGWETAAGRRIREAVHARCEDGEAKECLPR